MNCTDCRDHISAHAEHLLDSETETAFERHLATCAECREHVAFATSLCDRLIAHGVASESVDLAPPVLRRIHAAATRREPAGLARRARWWIGLGATAAAAAIVLVAGALLLTPGESRAQAAAVLNHGVLASTQLKTVRLEARMRTPPADNFSAINPQAPFTPVKVWKELADQKRWRIEKPGRMAWMNGQSTALYLVNAHEGVRLPVAASSAFDTEWLHKIADIEQTLANGLKMAQAKGWKMELASVTDTAGVVHKLVTIDVPADVPPGDYVYNKFLPTAESRRLFRFNDQSGQLEGLQIFLRNQGDYVLVFEVTRISYDEAFAADVFAPELPADVSWSEPPRPAAPSAVPADPKYAAMTAEEAARSFLEACARRDWTEVQNFFPRPLDARRKAALENITAVVHIGAAFGSDGYPGRFVPYEITLRNGATKKHNLALKKHPQTGGWYFDGGL